MIELGCCAFSFNDLSLERSLRMVHDLGFRRADVGLGQVGPAAEVAADPERHGERIRAAAGDAGVRLDEFFVLSVRPPDGAARPAAEAAKTFEGICRCARAAGFTSVLGAIESASPRDATGRAYVEARVRDLKASVEIAERHGLQVNEEPSFGTPLVTDPALAVALAEAVPGYGYTLDFAHFMAAGHGIEPAFALLPHTRHVHAKQSAPGYMKTCWHNGRIDFARIIRELKRMKWEGSMALECMSYGRDDRFDFGLYQEIAADGTKTPAEGLINHPAFQVVPLAYELARTLSGNDE